ncbi:MAG: glycoside hydrolase family 9 protein [Cyanobacteria bacterium P01_A01_bin.105]
MNNNINVTHDWGTGFVGELTVENFWSEQLHSWVLTFEAPFDITDLWNGEMVEREGNRYTVRAAHYSGELVPGQTTTIGFVANKAEQTTPQLTASSLEPVFSTAVLPGTTTQSGSNSSNPVAGSVALEPVALEPAVPEPIVPEPAAPEPVVPEPAAPETSALPAEGPVPGMSATGSFAYGEALQKSFLFYEAQRSGDLPENNRITWRGDSALTDGADVGLDLTGGYYDAGDHVKFGLPMAAAMTLLSWGVVEYYDAYQASGQLDEALAAIAWGTDYFLKAHVTDGQATQAFYGQVGNGSLDHSYWGSPETMNMPRPAYKVDRDHPGSDLTAETAAALAAAAIAFRQTDPAYADTLLDHAQQLYTFADTYRGRYSDSILDARSYYNSWSGYSDELSWGAAWLHRATGDPQYLAKAEQHYQGLGNGWTQNWDDKSYGAGILLAQATDKANYRDDVENWLDHWAGGGIQSTAGGLAWLDRWGALRYSANTAFLAGVYSDTVNPDQGQFDRFSRQQVDYILGDNPAQRSYLVGFGDDFPMFPHHRAASGTQDIDDPAANQHILYGALVGGPSSPQDHAYADERTDYISNEVALDYNAGLTGALVRLYNQLGGEPLSDATLASLPGVGV